SFEMSAVRLANRRLLQADTGEGFRMLFLQPADHLLPDLASQVPGGRRIPGAHQGAHLDGALLCLHHLQSSDAMVPVRAGIEKLVELAAHRLDGRSVVEAPEDRADE